MKKSCLGWKINNKEVIIRAMEKAKGKKEVVN